MGNADYVAAFLHVLLPLAFEKDGGKKPPWPHMWGMGTKLSSPALGLLPAVSFDYRSVIFKVGLAIIITNTQYCSTVF